MTAITPIGEADLEFDHGSFDSAAFTRQALADWQALAAVIDHTLAQTGRDPRPGGKPLRRGHSLSFCLCDGEPYLGVDRGWHALRNRHSRRRGDRLSPWRFAGFDSAAGSRCAGAHGSTRAGYGDPDRAAQERKPSRRRTRHPRRGRGRASSRRSAQSDSRNGPAHGGGETARR